MATTNFVKNNTIISADWLNDVDDAVYRKISQLTSVTDFSGVDLTGTTSSSAGIQLAASAAGDIIFPAGSYLIDAEISLSSNTTLHVADNAIFTFSGAMTTKNIFSAVSKSNIHIRGGQFVGDLTADADSTNLYGNAITFQSCSNVSVRGTTISDFPRAGIHLRATTEYIIEENEIYDIKPLTTGQGGMAGISIEDASNNGLVKSNLVHDIGDYGVLDSTGSGIRLIAQSGVTVPNNVTVTENNVYNIQEHGILMYHATGGSAEASSIHNNRVRDTGRRGLTETGTRGNGIYLLLTVGVTISNNDVRRTNTNTSAGSIINAAIATSSASTGNEQVIIEGNSVDTDPLSGIRAQGHNNLTISTNTVNVVGDSIWVADVDNCAISNNICLGDGTDNGIRVVVSATVNSNVAVTGNVVKDSTTGIAMTSVTNGSVTGNIIEDYTTQGVLITSCTNLNTTGNTIESATDVQSITSAGTNVNCTVSGNNIKARTAVTWPYVRNNVDGVRLEVYSTAQPANGTWRLSDISHNQAPTVDGNNMAIMGWICTVSGSPGTWLPLYTSTVTPAT